MTTEPVGEDRGTCLKGNQPGPGVCDRIRR